MDRPAEVQLDLAGGELVRDVASVWQGAGEAVELGHHEGVALATGGECFAEPRPCAGGAGEAVVDVDAFGFNAESGEAVALSGEVLFVG